MPKLSATSFAKAMAKANSITEQNQVMEIINVDVVDMVEQILTFHHADVPKPQLVEVPKDVHDVQKLITTAAARLRVILELERK